MPLSSPLVPVATMKLRVMGPDVLLGHATEKEIEETVQSINWAAVEDSINDQLPEGYYAKVDE